MRESAKRKQNVFISKVFSVVVASSIMISLLLNGCSSADKPVSRVDPKTAGFLFSEQGDYNELIGLINNQLSENRNSYNAQLKGNMVESAAEDSAAPDAGSRDGTGYSETNNQVEGVDEADIIKTDGSNIFVLVNNRLIIVDAANPENLKILSETKWNEYSENDDSVSGETPVELYLDIAGKRIAVITQSYSYPKYIEPKPGSELDRINPIINEKIYTTTYIYDINNPLSPQLERSFDQEGSYISSRMINQYIYTVSQKYQYAVYDLANDTTADPAEILPAVSQDGSTAKWSVVSASDVRIMPEGDMSNQLVLAGIDLGNPKNDANVLAVIGSTGIIYSSTENMYIAGARYVWNEIADDISADDISADNNSAAIEDSTLMPVDYWMPAETFTDIYKFRVSNGSIIEQGKGTVPGYLINQFSLDEHDGYLRVAVTTGDNWMPDQNTTENSIFVLNEKLIIAGQVTGLAKGEMIKSVRFMGDKAWMVTFRTTDPLFGIDLSIPDNPKVLSELKLPGYSSYLHPVSDNRLLGFGYDVEVSGENAFETGLKVSLFDISNLSSPIELDSMILGERGSWSEIIYQHKSLMSDDANSLYGFPATLSRNLSDDEFSFGSVYFQGLLLIDASTDKLNLTGGISHIDGLSDWTMNSTPDKNSEYLAYGPGSVFRGVRIGNQIYTLSRERLQANDLNSLDNISSVKLPGSEQEKYMDDYPEPALAD